MAHAAPFRDRDIALHQFCAELDSWLGIQEIRVEFCAYDAQYDVECLEFEERETERQRLRREYFFVEVVRRGNSHLLDRTTPVDGMEWGRLSLRSLEGVPARVLRAGFKDTDPKAGKLRRYAFDHGDGVGAVQAWAPSNLSDPDPPRDSRPELPLPPRSLRGRDSGAYTFAEIARGLRIFHQADGAFDAIVPFGPTVTLESLAITQRARELNDPAHSTFAKSTWIPSLRAQWARLNLQINSRCTASNGALRENRDDESSIPREYLSRIITKDEAARLLSGQSKGNPTDHLKTMIKSGRLTPPLGSGKSWQFDIREFPPSVHDKLR